MRALIKRMLLTTLSFYGVSLLFPGQIRYVNIQFLILMGVVFTLLTIFVKPFLKILLLPVNIITFGFFSWVINLLILYLAVLLVPGFHIGAITIPGATISIFVFPQWHLSIFWSYFLVSFLVSLGNGFLSWLL